MARRKELKVELTQLQEYDSIIKLLRDDPIFENFDLATIEIRAKGKITPAIKDPEIIIERLERYLRINYDSISGFKYIDGVTEQKYVTKTQLTKMLGISRTTLDKWIDEDFISFSYVGFGELPDNVTMVPILDPELILKDLKYYLEERNKKNNQ